MDWKARFSNKTWVTTFVTAIITFAYQILGMFDIVPPIAQDTIIQLLGVVVTMLMGLGIVVDGSSPGIKDSGKK